VLNYSRGIDLQTLHHCPKLQTLDLYQVCFLILTIIFDFLPFLFLTYMYVSFFSQKKMYVSFNFVCIINRRTEAALGGIEVMVNKTGPFQILFHLAFY